MNAPIAARVAAPLSPLRKVQQVYSRLFSVQQKHWISLNSCDYQPEARKETHKKDDPYGYHSRPVRLLRLGTE